MAAHLSTSIVRQYCHVCGMNDVSWVLFTHMDCWDKLAGGVPIDQDDLFDSVCSASAILQVFLSTWLHTKVGRQIITYKTSTQSTLKWARKKPHHIAQAFESSTTSDLSNWSSRTPASGPLEVADDMSLKKCEPCVCTLVESVLHLLISSHFPKSCWVTAAVGAIVVTRYLHLLRRRYKLTRQKSVPLLWYIQFCIPSQPYCLLASETIASQLFSVFSLRYQHYWAYFTATLWYAGFVMFREKGVA